MLLWRNSYNRADAQWPVQLEPGLPPLSPHPTVALLSVAYSTSQPQTADNRSSGPAQPRPRTGGSHSAPREGNLLLLTWPACPTTKRGGTGDGRRPREGDDRTHSICPGFELSVRGRCPPPPDPSKISVTSGSYINAASNDSTAASPDGAGSGRHQRVHRRQGPVGLGNNKILVRRLERTAAQRSNNGRLSIPARCRRPAAQAATSSSVPVGCIRNDGRLASRTTHRQDATRD